MKMVCCSIKDLGAQLFGRPLFVPAAAVAIRSFSDEVNAPKNPNGQVNDLFQHADDFELYELGEFDDSDGSFSLHKTPKLLIQAKQCKLPPKERPYSDTGM